MIFKYLLLFGLFCFSEEKGCPESSKPHLTRCDMYFKCALLASKNHVWIPTQCEEGLIYEPSLKMCVLPGDDWECIIDEMDKPPSKNDENNIYGINNLKYKDYGIQSFLPQYFDSLNSWNDFNNNDYIKKVSNSDNDSENIVPINSENYDENNIDISDGYEVIPIETNSELPENKLNMTSIMPLDDVESSGDGTDDKTDSKLEYKENFIAIPLSSDPNSSVASHLQRLSQLIQSLSDSQNNKSQSYELSPNELNNFLAHHNIKTEYHEQLTDNSVKHKIPEDGIIHPDYMSEILELQKQLQALKGISETITTTTTVSPPVSTLSKYKYPESTKIHVKSANPVKHIKLSDPGYSSSQIVVNRPEGSVLFSLPANGNPPSELQHDYKNEPYISQETLKTVLELSKQMISANNQQHNPNYIPEQNYLQPIFRPIYYNIPIQDIPIPVITNYEKTNGKYNEKQKLSNTINDDKVPSIISKITSPVRYEISNDYEDKKPDEHPTIIHNHIPITIEGPSPNTKQVNEFKQSPNRYPYQPPRQTTENSFDSYGEKVPSYPDTNDSYHSSYHPYPPFSEEGDHRPEFYSSFQQTQSLPPTNRPWYSSFNQYNYQQSPDPSPQYYQNQNQQYTFNKFPQGFSNYFTQMPHLSDQNVNSYLTFNTPLYPTIQPSSSTVNPNFMYQNQINSSIKKPEINEAISNKFVDQDKIVKSERTQLDEEINSDVVEDSIDEDINMANDILSETISSQKPIRESDMLIDDVQSSSNGDNKKKVVQFGGNFISYDAYKQSVAPLLHSGALENGDIEVISCITGSRQPNKTDCTRYFVCNPKTGNVLSYTCPPFTAFNGDSRFCDAKTYAFCIPSVMKTRITIDENRKIQMDALNALNEAKRIRDEALKTRRLTNLINLQTQNIINAPPPKRQIFSTSAVVTRTTKRPTPVKVQNKRRKIPCREPGNLPDVLSKYNYFSCYKGLDGSLKARKMACPSGLIFCAGTKLCTSSSRCSS